MGVNHTSFVFGGLFFRQIFFIPKNEWVQGIKERMTGLGKDNLDKHYLVPVYFEKTKIVGPGSALIPDLYYICRQNY